MTPKRWCPLVKFFLATISPFYCTITQALAWCVYVIICAQGPWIRWIIMIAFHRWESKSCKFDIFSLQEDSIRFDCSENRDWFWLKWNNRSFVNALTIGMRIKISKFRFRVFVLFSIFVFVFVSCFQKILNYKNIFLENNFFFELDFDCLRKKLSNEINSRPMMRRMCHGDFLWRLTHAIASRMFFSRNIKFDFSFAHTFQ